MATINKTTPARKSGKTATKPSVNSAVALAAPVPTSTAGRAEKSAKAAHTVAAKPAAATKPTIAAKPVKIKKIKMVRDSLSMPKTEYAVLDALKLRAAKLGRPTKKTEIIRAGIKAVAALTDATFLAALQAVLEAGRSAVLLVPEIGLTPAAAARLQATFGEQAAILHSGLTAGERAGQWHRIRRGEARIVVGTRSAVFAPVANLALIVVDEEQDPSYKQEETPRYHGRDVAIMRAKQAGAAVVLGSATPALESFYNTQRGKYTLLELRERVEQRPLPAVEIVDMREEFRATGEDQLFSRKLVGEIRERLERGEQAMILLNRRGYSAVVLCRACGETVECQNCAIALTHHKGRNRLLCHYCGYQQAVPEACPKCGSEYVQFLGTGSEKLEERIQGAFPRARVGRLDRDTVRGRGDF